MITRESKKKATTTKKRVDTYEIEWYDFTSDEKRESTVITSEMFYIIYDVLTKREDVKDIKVWAVMTGRRKLINDPEKQVMEYMRNAVINMLDAGYGATEVTTDGSKDKEKGC